MTPNDLLEPPDVTLLESAGYTTVRVTEQVLACMDRNFALAARFYAQDKAEKRRCTIPELHEGWQDLGNEFSKDASRPDLSESFWVTHKNRARVEAVYTEEGLAFYHQMAECLAICHRIERAVTAALLRYFGHDDAAPGFECDRDSDLLMFYYQPMLHSTELLQDDHEDGLYLTLAKPSAPGLELLLPNGRYHPVELERDEVLVMPGEILSLLAGYKIAPLVHRVARREGLRERFSLCYFGHPNMDRAKVLPPWVLNETNHGVDIMARIFDNKEMYLVK